MFLFTGVTMLSFHNDVRDIVVKCCQTNLISCCDQVTSLVDCENPVDIIYLEFSKAFDKVEAFKRQLESHLSGMI